MSPLRLRRFFPAALLLLFCIFAPLNAQDNSGPSKPRVKAEIKAQPTPRQLTLNERIEVFEDTWDTIYQRYYDANFNGIDWQAEHKHYRPLIEKAASNEEFYPLLKTMVSSLHDSHTRVFTPDEKSDWEHPRFISIGLTIRKIEGRPVVVDVKRHSEADSLGIRPGYVLAKVEDKPVEEVITSLRELYGTSSTERASELRVYSRLFNGRKDTRIKLSFLDGNEEPVTVSIKRFEEIAEPELIYRRLPGDYGYISFNGFWPETAAAFEHAIKALYNCQGLIIDLRENGGGAAFSAASMASFLFPKETSLGQFTGRDGHVIEPKTEGYEHPYFSGQVEVLIGERSGSGAEVFAATLQEQGRVSVIGRPSCGCVLGINRRHALPDGGLLDVSEVDYHTAMGRRLEGVGVIPDTLTVIRISDLLAGRDEALETALAKLREATAIGASFQDNQQ